MKIILALEQNLLPLNDGIRKQVWFHAKELKKLNPKLEIEIINISNSKSHKRDGIKIINKNKINFYFNKCDILHYFGCPSPIVYLLLKFARFKKFFITMCDGDLCSFWNSNYSKLSLKGINKYASQIHLYTKYQKEKAAQFFQKEKIKIIQPYFENYKKIGNKSKNPSLLFMSHLSPIKGIDIVLKSYKNLINKYPNLELTIADSGLKKAPERYIKEIKDINEKGGKIILKGFVNPQKELSKTWIYLYPFKKQHETFAIPLSLYEAEQCQTFFISSNLGNNNNFFNEDFLLNNINSKELEREINNILFNIKKNKNYFNKIKLLQQKNKDNKLVVKELHEIYNKNTSVFVYSNPKPHYVHLAFANSVCNETINCELYKKNKYLIPLYTIKAFLKNRKIIKNNVNFFLIGGVGLFLSKLIKIFYRNKKILLLNADPLFYALNKKSKINKYLHRFLLKSISSIICNSNLNLNYTKKYFKGKINKVYPFIREEILNLKFKKDKNNISFMYIGRQSKEKNLDLIIDYVNSKKYKLFFIGNFNNTFKKKNKRDDIIFLGYKKTDELMKLSKIKYGFLLSDYDSFGITPLEYALLGIIPIVSQNCGSNEILNNKEIIVKKLDLEEINNTITKLENINKDKLILNLRKNIKKHSLTEKIQVQKFKEIFTEMIS